MWNLVLNEVHVGSTWQTLLNCLGMAAMPPYVNLLWSVDVFILCLCYLLLHGWYDCTVNYSSNINNKRVCIVP